MLPGVEEDSFSETIKTLLDVKRVHIPSFIKISPLTEESIGNKPASKQRIIYLKFIYHYLLAERPQNNQ